MLDWIECYYTREHWFITLQVYDYFDKYTFLCDMYDEEADAIVELVLNFFPFDNSVQVINTTKGKNLLRRVQLPHLTLEMLQIGNIVNIFSKLLYITDCAPATRRTLFNNVQRYHIFIPFAKLHGTRGFILLQPTHSYIFVPTPSQHHTSLERLQEKTLPSV